MAVVAAAFFIGGMLQREWVYIPHRTLVSLMALWLITYVIIHQNGNTLRFKWIFNNRVLIFLGKISYGIYLYHNIIPGMLNTPFISKYLNPLLPELIYKKFGTPLFIIENAILVVIISWMSFRFIEKPFLSLKKYFEYKPNPLS